MRSFLSLTQKILLLTFFILCLLYLSPDSPEFPIAPPDAVQSLEEADTESIFRRAYFTNYSREEVLKHYEDALGQVKMFGILMPSYRLNYPPEDAYAIIRDQTRSTFLEEIVHPFRESIYVNGFKAKSDKDDIWYKGVHYDQKITIRYVPSDRLARITIFSAGLLLLPLVIREFLISLKRLAKEVL